MMPSEAYSYLSSRLVREVCQFGGAISGLVPRNVEDRLLKKIASMSREGQAAANPDS